MKFKEETPGMCCSSGKVKLPELEQLKDPLKSLLTGITGNLKRLFKNIRNNNFCFQMTSFGANVIAEHLIPTFKIQGQIYHIDGSLLPFLNNHKFLRIYWR